MYSITIKINQSYDKCNKLYSFLPPIYWWKCYVIIEVCVASWIGLFWQILPKCFLKFNKLLKSATTDQSATSLLGLCKQCLHSLQGLKVKVTSVTNLMWKNTKKIRFFRRLFSLYRICLLVCSKCANWISCWCCPDTWCKYRCKWVQFTWHGGHFAIILQHHGPKRLYFSIFFNVSDQIWCQNETKLHGEYDYECIRNSLSTYPLPSW